jgi:geranylgeranyl diphosphate synthase type II
MVEKYLSLIEAEIRKQKFGTRPKSLYEPIRYIMSLGGKRLRPLLTLLSYSLYRSGVEKIIPYAAAVEAFHNFTLLHDDIMDKAPLRRGKATVHKKWDVNTAILSGDVMLVKVYEMFQGLEQHRLQETLRIFNQCASEVCEGQQWDMEFERKRKVSEGEYIEMIRLKTAVLLGFSLELGALLAGASDQDRMALRDFGINIGIGFQLKDDWLDVYANKRKFGKQVGGDIIANKKTFLLIKALEKAKGKQKTELAKWVASKRFRRTEKVKAVTSLYDDLQISFLTEKKIKFFFEKGFACLGNLSAPKKATHLRTYVKQLINRET